MNIKKISDGKSPIKEEKDPKEIMPTDTEDATTTEAEEVHTTPSKPQSAGANVRDAANRILTLCQKGEWSPVDQVLKSIERTVAGAGEDVHVAPLAGVLDTVNKQ